MQVVDFFGSEAFTQMEIDRVQSEVADEVNESFEVHESTRVC